MRWRRLFPCTVLCGLAAPLAVAGAPVRVSLEPVPFLVQGEDSPAFLLDAASQASLAETDSLVYSNTHFTFYNPLAWFPPGEGKTIADDLHLTEPGYLTHFWFFYHEPLQSTVRITAAFYANEGNDDSLGPLVAGPFELGPYRWGAYKVHIAMQEPVYLPRDVWFALRFESLTAGAVLANPPFVGTSHDVYYNFELGQTDSLLGAFANIYMQVRVDLRPVGIEPATWSRVKALYRSTPVAHSNAP